MGEATKIAWCDATFNPWVGCSKVSPACDNCYAEKGSARLGAQHGLKLWQGDRYHTSPAYWREPLRWNRAALAAGVRRRVFCASYADVFEQRDDLLEPRARLWALMQATPGLDWLLLTKRPEHAMRLAEAAATRGPSLVHPYPPNAWFGTTAETQEHYEARWAKLALVPAAVRFISHEPALGQLDLHPAHGNVWPHWVITGGESGPRARGYDLGWARTLVEHCRLLGIACFVKQLGARPMAEGRPVLLQDKKGGDPSEWEPSLRVQQWPAARPRT